MRFAINTFLFSCPFTDTFHMNIDEKDPAVLPAVMFLCYCGLILYLKSRGGYRPVEVKVRVST